MVYLLETTTKDVGFITLKQQSKKYIIRKVGIITLVLAVLGFIAGILMNVEPKDFSERLVIAFFFVLMLGYWAVELNHIEKAVNELL